MTKDLEFKSSLSLYMKMFVEEKVALGYKYESEKRRMQHFDQYCLEHGDPDTLNRKCVDEYLLCDPNRSAKTKLNIIGTLRQFAFFLICNGREAYIYPLEMCPKEEHLYKPYIFTHGEINRLMDAADCITPNCEFPTRHKTLPLIYRTLYCCGLRISEALALTVGRIDFANDMLLLGNTKGYRDRMIPLSGELSERYSDYYHQLRQGASGDTYFFQSDYGNAYSRQAVADNFRKLLWKCGISYGGRLKGPSLHCLRHTFSIHCLQKAMDEGKELKEFLPILSAYLGHESLQGTMTYLHFTAELYPDILKKLDECCGGIIPEAGDFYE